MRSFFEKKSSVLLIAVLALVALTVLSFGIKNISFGEVQPIGRNNEAKTFRGDPQAAAGQFGEVSLKSQIIVWVALTLLTVLIGLILSPEARKRLFRAIIRVAATYWALYFVFKKFPNLFSFLNMGLGERPSAPAEDAAASLPPPVFTPPRETSMFSYLTSILIVLVLLYLAWRMYSYWKLANPPPDKSLDEIARIARTSLRELSSGRESTDVIMNCYFRMSDVVAGKKNLERGISVTPAEFASHLVREGLPSDAVKRLTNLFEAVRYGGRKTGPKEINEAVVCLTAILQYCGESV